MSKHELTQYEIEQSRILESFKPDSKLMLKYFVQFYLILILIVGSISLFTLFIWYAADGFDIDLATILGIVIGTVILLIALIGSVLIPFYINSINYTLTTHEVIVNKGIITKSQKVVSFRNITNFNQRIGPFDRLIGGENFGTVAIETAGMSGQKARPEQKMEGVVPVRELTARLRAILMKMKGQAAVTADMETAPALEEEELLKQILATLKDISNKI